MRKTYASVGVPKTWAMAVTSLKRRLPPPNSLVVFEAAARLQSFTAAAEELNVTQAAVSRQMQNLENSLGAKLFAREYRKLTLTAAGVHFHRAVSMGLEFIASSASELRDSSVEKPEITVSSTVAVSAFWLRPKIAAYLTANPAVDIRLLASDDEQARPGTDADIVIRYGHGKWPGLEASFLFAEEIYPVCGPRYLNSRTITRPSDLLQETLLHFDRKNLDWIDWEAWLQGFGCKGLPLERGLHFNNYNIVIQAALEGQGIALGWNRIISQLLKDGHLIRLLSESFVTDRAYWMVWKNGSLGQPAERFRDWLSERARIEVDEA